MARDNTTNPWGDAANQAVGAMYKYYMSQPTQADALKSQYMQAQIDRMGTQNEMDNRQMGLGDYALPNLSPEIRNIMYRNSQQGPAQQIFDAYVRPPMQIDTGDTKVIADGVTGLPRQTYGVGIAPERKIDVEGGQIINAPAIPSMNRPAATPMAQMLDQYVGGTNQVPAVSEEEFNNYPVQPVSMSNAPLNTSMLGGDIESEVLPPIPNNPAVQSYIDKTNQIAGGMQPPQAAPSNVTVQPDGTTISALPMSPVAAAKKDKAMQLKSIQGDLVNDDIQRALGALDGSMPVTGIGGAMTKGIPGTAAHNLEQTLTTIQANIGFDKLQAMREASPTGGALGQVSDFENRQLQAIYGSLAQSQSEEQFRYNLMRLYNTYNDTVHGSGNGERYDIPTMEKIMQMQTPEDIQKAMEFFDYNPPDEIENAIVQRANQLGL